MISNYRINAASKRVIEQTKKVMNQCRRFVWTASEILFYIERSMDSETADQRFNMHYVGDNWDCLSREKKHIIILKIYNAVVA